VFVFFVHLVSEQEPTKEQADYIKVETTLAEEFDRKSYCIVRPHIAHEFFAIFHDTVWLPIKDTTALPTISLFDVGLCASRILLNPEEHLGVDYTLSGQKLYGAQIAADLSVALDQRITFEHMINEV
jgi:hypothetical protein